MSDQLKMDLLVCPSPRAWSVSTLHVAQTHRGDNRSVHQTQRSQNKRGTICFSCTAAFIIPFQRAGAGNKEKAERTGC